MLDQLFRWRGPILGAVALLMIGCSRGSPHSLLLAAPLIVLGLGLRAWAVAHIGRSYRTRDPAPPLDRVCSGPYRFATHPIYLANLILATALLVAARPPLVFGTILAAAVVLFYGLLMRREGELVRGLPPRPLTATLPLWMVLRAERSTWFQLLIACALLLCKALLGR